MIPTAAVICRKSLKLDLDGGLDALPGLLGQAAYLALDRNGNGRIDDGSELFGPKLGNGFVELAAYDQQSDGRIDAADEVYDRLLLWHPGQGLQRLQDSGITALMLNPQAMNRALYRNDKLMGLVREQSMLEGVQPGQLLEVVLRV